MKNSSDGPWGLHLVRHVIPAAVYSRQGPAGPGVRGQQEPLGERDLDAEDVARVPAPVAAGDHGADGVSGYVERRALTGRRQGLQGRVVHAQALAERPQPAVAWILQVEPHKSSCRKPALGVLRLGRVDKPVHIGEPGRGMRNRLACPRRGRHWHG